MSNLEEQTGSWIDDEAEASLASDPRAALAAAGFPAPEAGLTAAIARAHADGVAAVSAEARPELSDLSDAAATPAAERDVSLEL